MTRIVSVWLPLWPIERLARALPGAVPADRPLALVEGGAHGLLVSAVNEVAAQEGVRPGQTLADARAALPALASRPAEPDHDRAALVDLARWSECYGPRRNLAGDDGLWIDITGVAHLFGGESALAADLGRRLRGFGLTARLGLADTHGAALALARYGASSGSGPALAAAAPGRTREALAALPVEGLRLAAGTAQLLRRLGLVRIGDLYGLPRAALERRFREMPQAGSGRAGRRRMAAESAAVLTRLDQALGLLHEPLRPLDEPPLSSARRAFPEPLVSAEPLSHAIAALAHELAEALTATGRGARRLRLSLFRVDGVVLEVRIGTSRPCREGAHLVRLLAERLGDIDAGFGIDVAILAAIETAALDPEQTYLLRDRRQGRAPADAGRAAAALLDRLTNRLGAEAVLCHAPRASHAPERAEILVAACAAAAAPPGTRRPAPPAMPPGAAAVPAAIRLPQPRPALLLARPEPIRVVAEMPEGAPAQFTWRRVLRRITRAEGPERIAPEWWRALHLRPPAGRPGIGLEEETGEPEGSSEPSGPNLPRVRDYYRIEDEQGAGFWVFRAGIYGAEAQERAPQWFLHGLFV